MATYSYIVIDSLGKERKGTLPAENKNAAAEELKRQGNTLVSLDDASILSKDVDLSFFSKRPKARDLAVFCRQFVSILDAGVSVTAALEMLGDQTENKTLAVIINECRMSIEKGSTLADAMRDHREVFSDIFITMVAAGEASGSLEISFERMAVQFEKDAKLKGTIKKASVYPMIVCIVAAVVVVIMLAFVVPSFEEMLTDLGTDLPGITKFVIAASDTLVQRWYYFAGAIVLIIVGIRQYKRTEGGGYFFGRIGIRAPLFGKLTVKTASARMCRTLSTLLAAGVPMMEALGIVSKTMANVHFREVLENAKGDVAMGTPLSETIERSGIFPSLVHHMLKIGEETGNIEGMLTKLADYYDEEVEITTQQIMAALEPAIIVVLCVVIGTIIMAVVMPMASMYGALDNL